MNYVSCIYARKFVDGKYMGALNFTGVGMQGQEKGTDTWFFFSTSTMLGGKNKTFCMGVMSSLFCGLTKWKIRRSHFSATFIWFFAVCVSSAFLWWKAEGGELFIILL